LITGPTRAPTPVVTTSPSNLDDLFVQLIGTTIRDDIGLPFQGADNELAITGLVSFRWEIRTTVRGMSASRDRPQHAWNDFHASRLLYDSPRSRSECLGRLSRDCHHQRRWAFVDKCGRKWQFAVRQQSDAFLRSVLQEIRCTSVGVDPSAEIPGRPSTFPSRALPNPVCPSSARPQIQATHCGSLDISLSARPAS
jgi:hypothetical protein